ncbi:protein phosphatase 1 regulatory subunit 3C-B-like isoform X2 [Antennarius striatus]
MPVDMRVCLSSSPHPRQPFGEGDAHLLRRCRPLRSCLAQVAIATPAPVGEERPGGPAGEEQPGGRAWPSRKQRKRVAFADARGGVLTTIHLIDDELQFHLSDMGGATASLQQGGNTAPPAGGSGLVLAFTPPADDYLLLRSRLWAQQVCLETCRVRVRLLSGTVQVRNLSFEKWVSLRITFDSWRSFRDVPCQYLNNVYGCPDTNTFSFSVRIPEAPPPDAIQFCIQYRTPDQTFWDNHHGNNYRLAGAGVSPLIQGAGPARGADAPVGMDIQGGQKTNEIEFDPYGSPRTSAGIFPEWQSWGGVETSAPYW